MKLRPATFDDANVLLAIRNNPDVRAASRSVDAISPTMHAAWLRQALVDPRVRLWIAESPESTTLGYGRLTQVDDSGLSIEVTLAIAAPRRHQGHGTALVRLLTDEAVRRGAHALAVVNTTNVASLIAFLHNEYTPVSIEPDLDARGGLRGFRRWVHLIRQTSVADAPRVCYGCARRWPHRRHPLDRISSRWASEAEREADMATWPVLYDLHEEPVDEGQVLVHECTAAKLFDRRLA